MSPLLAKMRQYAPVTHWVCAEDVIYPFHAKLLVPPEIAVVMAKRYWSGEINALRIVEICRRYNPEQVLLPNGRRAGEWGTFLSSGYDLVCANDRLALFVRNDIKQQALR